MKFCGIIPALLTAYDEEGEVNFEAIRSHAVRLMDEGIGGLFLCGSTSECWTLTDQERMRIAEEVLGEIQERTKVMVHVGTTSTRASIRLARHAEKIGADAISALPPIGFLYAPDDVWNHWRAIADSCGLPFYLYHLPQVFGDLITIDRFLAATDTMPTLAGAKFSSYRIDDLIHLRVKAKGRLNIISGCGEQLLSAMSCGADGSICTWYNMIPRLANKVVTCLKNNDVNGARAHEEILVSIATICSAKPIANMKWIIRKRGLDVGTPRSPLAQVGAGDGEALYSALDAAGHLEWFI